MKAEVVVGPVEIRVTGMPLTERQLRRLVSLAGDIATSLLDESAEPEKEAPAPIGFAAQVERAPDLTPESRFTDDD